MKPLLRFPFVVAGTALAIFSTACRADGAAGGPATRCEPLEPHDAAVDPQVLALRTAHPADLLRACKTPGAATRYSAITVPGHTDPALCRYTESFPDPDVRPEVWVRQERGACPAPDKAAYFSIDAVPDDVLPRLLDLLREMATSDAGFDTAASGLDPATTPRSSARFEHFRRAMRSSATQLLSIERVGPDDEPRGGFFLAFSDASSPSTRWRLGIVPAGDRLLLRRIDEGAID